MMKKTSWYVHIRGEEDQNPLISFPPFLLYKLWKCDETWEVQSDIQLYCLLQKITVYYCIL